MWAAFWQIRHVTDILIHASVLLYLSKWCTPLLDTVCGLFLMQTQTKQQHKQEAQGPDVKLPANPSPPPQPPPSPPLGPANGPRQDLTDLTPHAAVLVSHATVHPSHPPNIVRLVCRRLYIAPCTWAICTKKGDWEWDIENVTIHNEWYGANTVTLNNVLLVG